MRKSHLLLNDGRTFSQAMLDDFKEFHEAGITHPDMEKIKALLTGKAQDTNSTNSHYMINLTRASCSFMTIRVIGVVTAVLFSLLVPITHIHAQTQASMNAEAHADFKKADAELNKTYETLLAKLPDAESKKKLKESQRAWLAFRDAEAAFEADEAHGGTMAPTLRYATMTELTEQRIKQLKLHLAE